MGMLEYKKENENQLIKTIITGKTKIIKAWHENVTMS